MREENLTVYPYYGHKRLIARKVWSIIGDVDYFYDPFMGSNSFLLYRPKSHKRNYELVSDRYAHLTNFWRSVRYAPKEVIKHYISILSSVELRSRLLYVRKVEGELESKFEQELQEFLKHQEEQEEKLMADLDYYNPRYAGIWLFCAKHLIGSELYQYGRYHSENGRIVEKQPSYLGINQSNINFVKKPEIDFSKLENKLVDLSERIQSTFILNSDYTLVFNWVEKFLNNDKKLKHALFLDPPYSSMQIKQRRFYRTIDNPDIEAARAALILAKKFPNLQIVFFNFRNTIIDELLTPESSAILDWNHTGHNYMKKSGTGGLERIWFLNVPKEQVDLVLSAKA